MKKEVLAISLIVFLISVFFLRLFYPTISLFVTPDFGGSDLWQLNLPAKYFLSQSLKDNQLPVWNSDIGLGFPVLAEGQIGVFNFFNLLLFKSLPFTYAFNLSFIFLFLFSALGAYFYLRIIKIHLLVSLFSGLTFAFSAFFIGHISHLNLIQTASFLPWLFFFSERILQRKQMVDYLVFSLLVSQQIFSGFPQVAFISLLTILIYLLLKLSLGKENFLKKTLLASLPFFFKISFFIGLGFSLSALQLFPQLEFLRISTREKGFSLGEAVQYSFPPKNLATLLNPRILGTPENGTYPDLPKSNFAVYWENNAFLGFLPLIALFVGFFLVGKNKLIKNYFLLWFFSLLMMLGRYSPLYVIFIFPPFSFFRAPSRFILPFIWSVVVLSALVLNSFFKKQGRIIKPVLVVLMILSLAHLFSFDLNYNPLQPADKILKPSETAQFLQKTAGRNDRFFLVPDHELWNQVFLNKGWQNFEPFVYFRNNLNSNLNLLYNLTSVGVYPIQVTKRFDVLRGLISSGIAVENEKATINDLSLKLLSLGGARYFISAYEITEPKSLQKVFETQNNFSEFPSYKIYLNPQALPRAYFVNSTIKAKTVDQLANLLAEEKFNISKTAIVEKEAVKTSEGGLKGLQAKETAKIVWQKNDHQEIVLKVSVLEDGLLVLTDTFYPGWYAYVDNQPSEILPVNLNSRGIIVNGGEHHVKFLYQPKSLFWGKIVSLTTLSLLVVLTTLILRVNSAQR